MMNINFISNPQLWCSKQSLPTSPSFNMSYSIRHISGVHPG